MGLIKGKIAKISESGKTAILVVRDFMNSIPVYVPNDEYEVGQEVVFNNVSIVDWTDHATKDGIQLKTLSSL
jgi:hypothetical protein